MKPGKTFIYLVLSAILLLSAACTANMEEIRGLTEEEDLPVLTMQGMKSIYTSDAKLQMQLTAPVLYRFEEEQGNYFEFPEGCKINFYNEQVEVQSSLKADYGIYKEKEETARTSGNVVLTNTNGSILRTSELFLKGDEKRIYSVKPVTITYSDGSVIQGDGGFESNYDFTIYRFSKVSGIQRVEESF